MKPALLEYRDALFAAVDADWALETLIKQGSSAAKVRDAHIAVNAATRRYEAARQALDSVPKAEIRAELRLVRGASS